MTFRTREIELNNIDSAVTSVALSSQLGEACNYSSVENTFVWYFNLNLDYMLLYFY